MSCITGVKNHPRTGLKTTQLQGLVSDLTEQEQEMLSGFGGRDDGWLNGFSIESDNQELQKHWLGSNFRVSVGDLPCD